MSRMNDKTAALYARVSSQQQREDQTIASQVAALQHYAAEHGYLVPEEWVFLDEGYTGASLLRPRLERLRDLAAQGQPDAVLVHSPDRLARKYAYQVLVVEELKRGGVEVTFLKSSRGDSPEDELLRQFQGMIAEYERALIAERTRRGRIHRARAGDVGVMSGAPYGYRYVRKTDSVAAHYEIIESEAHVVREIFRLYNHQRLRPQRGEAALERAGRAHQDRQTVLVPDHRVGHPAQPRLQGQRRVWEDPSGRTHPAADPSAAPARWRAQPPDGA